MKLELTNEIRDALNKIQNTILSLEKNWRESAVLFDIFDKESGLSWTVNAEMGKHRRIYYFGKPLVECKVQDKFEAFKRLPILRDKINIMLTDVDSISGELLSDTLGNR